MNSEELYIQGQTEEDFTKARARALVNGLVHFLSPEETKMISLGDMKSMLKPTNEVYEGVKVVPLKLIVGSEGRFRDFDNRFFPKSLHLKARWQSIDKAHLDGTELPPITLYELGGLYFVRDGNHRVSVAKSRGVQTIDAEVVSLQSEIHLTSGESKAKIVKHIINYEKRMFYTLTGFGDITDYWCLDFTTTGMYDVIYNHINSHKYYINLHTSHELSMEEAIQSWFTTLYLPFVAVIKEQRTLSRFHGRTYGDLYVWLVKYWDDLKRRFGPEYSMGEATKEFTDNYGSLTIDKLYKDLKWRVKNTLKKVLLTQDTSAEDAKEEASLLPKEQPPLSINGLPPLGASV